MAVKDGLPSTDFSRMNREYIKALVGEGGDTGLPAVTEADNGKILGVVNGAWGAMDAGGGGSSDFSTAEVIIRNPSNSIANIIISNAVNTPNDAIDTYIPMADVSEKTITAVLYKGVAIGYDMRSGVEDTVTGDISFSNGVFTITGDGTITVGERQ